EGGTCPGAGAVAVAVRLVDLDDQVQELLASQLVLDYGNQVVGCSRRVYITGRGDSRGSSPCACRVLHYLPGHDVTAILEDPEHEDQANAHDEGRLHQGRAITRPPLANPESHGPFSWELSQPIGGTGAEGYGLSTTDPHWTCAA